MKWFLVVVKDKYATFSGRAHREEYWMYILFYWILSFGVSFVERLLGIQNPIGVGIIGLIISLALFIPSLAAAVRRLHDIGKSGWWLLLSFIPILGWIALIVFMVLPGTPGANAFGPDPRDEK